MSTIRLTLGPSAGFHSSQYTLLSLPLYKQALYNRQGANWDTYDVCTYDNTPHHNTPHHNTPHQTGQQQTNRKGDHIGER